MAEGPRGRRGGSSGDDDYGWLYGDPGRGRPPADPEPTRMMPTHDRPQGRPPGQPRPAPRPSPQGPYQEPGRQGQRPQQPPRGSGRRPGDGPPPRPPYERRAAPPGPRRPRRRLRWVKVALLLWLVFLLAVPVWAWTKVAKVDAEPDGGRPGSQPGSNYLLVGSDSREGLSRAERRRLGTGNAAGRRTDTIMLLHTGSGPNLLLSIPRDSIVDIPGHGRTKVNAAYALGGPELLVETLESETGIHIDSYVEIGFGGFVSVIDAVGGIEICPEEAMQDPLANLDVEAGCQEADGATALGYARSRKVSALGDIDRARRQREVVSAVGSEAVSPWSVLNPVRYVRLAGASADALTVGEDTGPFDTLRFAWAMTRLGGDNGRTCGVPIADLAVTWDRDRALELFELIKEDRTDDITGELCSASGVRGQ